VMAHRLALERFDLDLAPSSGALRGPIPGAGPAACAGAEQPEDDGADAAPADPVEPAEPAPPDRAWSLARIAEALQDIEARAQALRASAEEAAAEAFAVAAARVLPELARTGFAAELASSSLQLARAGGLPRIELRIAPEDEAALTAALGAADAPADAPELQVSADPRIEPGQAALAWTDGGAELDSQALTEAALALMRQRLAVGQRQKHEETAR